MVPGSKSQTVQIDAVTPSWQKDRRDVGITVDSCAKSVIVSVPKNVIREFCTFHRANGEGETTQIGSRNFFMVGVHIAHNCIIGDDNILANEVALAGHITLIVKFLLRV